MMTETPDPAAAGFDPARLDLLAETIERDIAAEIFDGCVVIVARKAGPVFHRAFGFADRDTGRKMEKGALIHSMSIGNTTSAMGLRHVELGDFRPRRPSPASSRVRRCRERVGNTLPIADPYLRPDRRDRAWHHLGDLGRSRPHHGLDLPHIAGRAPRASDQLFGLCGQCGDRRHGAAR